MSNGREASSLNKFFGYLGMAAMFCIFVWLFVGVVQQENHIHEAMEGPVYASISLSELLADRDGEFDKKAVIVRGEFLHAGVLDNRLDIYLGPEIGGRKVRGKLDASKWWKILLASGFVPGDVIRLKGYVWRTLTEEGNLEDSVLLSKAELVDY